MYAAGLVVFATGPVVYATGPVVSSAYLWTYVQKEENGMLCLVYVLATLRRSLTM